MWRRAKRAEGGKRRRVSPYFVSTFSSGGSADAFLELLARRAEDGAGCSCAGVVGRHRQVQVALEPGALARR